MTPSTVPPPEAETMRRFSGKKLQRLLERRGERPAWIANGVKCSEMSVRNWLAGKKPDLDSYLDLVDFLRKEGIDESEVLIEVK